MTTATQAVNNRKKRRLMIVAFLLSILLMIAALWAFFTDYNTGYHTVSAGSLDIKQSFELYHNDTLVGKNTPTSDSLQDSSGRGGVGTEDSFVEARIDKSQLTSTSTSYNDGDGDGVIENFNPGDTVTLKITVQNYGTKSLWMRPSLRLTGAAIDENHDGTYDTSGKVASLAEYDQNFIIYEQVSRVDAPVDDIVALTQTGVKQLTGNGYDGTTSLASARQLDTSEGQGFQAYSEANGDPYASATKTSNIAGVNALRYSSNRLFVLNGQNGNYGAFSNPSDDASYYVSANTTDTAATTNAQDAEYEGRSTTTDETSTQASSDGSDHFLGTHKITYIYTIYFKPTALNEMQGTNLSVGYLLEAVQYRNNTKKDPNGSDIRIKSGKGTSDSDRTNTAWNAVDGWQDVLRLELE